jgi:outer membrane protein
MTTSGPAAAWRALAFTPVKAIALLALLVAADVGAAQWLGALRADALARDPAVAGAQAQARAAEERVLQARAGFGPTMALTAGSNESRYTEAPENQTRQFASRQISVQLTQPLIRNTLLPTLDAAQAQLEQAQAQLEQARAEVHIRLLEATFDALKARDALALVRAQRLAAEEQLASARRSFAVGVATVVDVREAEARIDTVDAQALAAQADLELRAQFVGELVGRPVPELLERSLTGDFMPALPAAGVLEWLADAQARNPQLGAARRALEAAEAEVRKAWQGHAPTLDFNASYTQSSDTGTPTTLFPRRGNTSTVGLNFNLPLFASGATHSKVREVQALREKAQSDVDAALRAVQINVRQSFTAALSAVGLAKGLETATRSLETALRANRRAYEVGMKVNVDVLEAQSRLFEARRDLSRARYDAWLNFLRLKSFAGRLGEPDFELLERGLETVPAAMPAPQRQRPSSPPPAGERPKAP